MHDFDSIIIGGGPAGTKCAMELAHGGQKVALIEKTAIGGTCLNVGCIPSKSYLYAAELLDNIKKAQLHGIKVSEPTVDWQALKKRAMSSTGVRNTRALTKLLRAPGTGKATGVTLSPST